MRHFPEDRPRLKELILYISKQAEPDENFGSTALNKLLFFADFLSYAKFGKPITGAEYIREKHGPVPKPVRTGRNSPIAELERAGALRREATRLTGVPKEMTRVKPIALRQADMSLFSEDEINLVNQVIATFYGWPAGKISKYTHELPQWHSVPLLEVIPYETVFVAQDQRFTEAETQHGLELARRYGWPLSKPGR